MTHRNGTRHGRLLLPAAMLLVPAVAVGQDLDSTQVGRDSLRLHTITETAVIRVQPYAESVGGDSPVTRAQPRLVLGEIMTAIPGIEVQNRYNYAVGDRLSIRGFGARTQFGIRGVRVLVDDVPATMADGQSTLDHLDLATVSHVQIWRGPSSALYGNASGGMVSYTTGGPPEGRFRQGLSVEGGSNELLRIESSTAGRIGRTTGELDASVVSYGGYREYSAADKVLATARINYAGAKDNVRFVFHAVDFEGDNPGSLNEAAVDANPDSAHPFNVLQQAGKAARQAQFGLTWRRRTDAGSLRMTGWGLGRTVSNPIPTSVIELDRLAAGVRGQWDNWYRVGDISGRLLIGFEAAFQDDDRKSFANIEGAPGPLSLDQRDRVWNVAPFGQVKVMFLPEAMLIAGLRYDWIRFRLDDYFTDGDPDDSGSRSMGAVSPTIGIFYSFSSLIGLHATFATAFETPTTTELLNRREGTGGLNAEVQPQRTTSWEARIEGALNARTNYQIGVYRARVRNELIPFEVPSDPGRTFFDNAGSARHEGVEASVDFRSASGLTVRGQYTYTNARFLEFAIADESFDGLRIPGAAPHRAELMVAYDARSGWYVSATGRYVHALPVNNSNSESAPSYAVSDARFGVRGLEIGSSVLSPFVGISNILDRTYVSAVTPNAFGGRYFEPGPGFAFWVGLKWLLEDGTGT